MKKTLKIVGLVLVTIILLAAAGLMLAGGSFIKGAINTFGPAVLGVPVTLQDAKFMPFRGKIKLTKLHVGNPEGFKTPGLFNLGDVDIELNSRSLFSDIIIIHKIIVMAPEITYERGVLDSNFGKLTRQLQGDGAKAAEGKKPDKGKKDKTRKVIIEQLVVSDPKLNISITAAGGHAIPVALGRVELKDIGKESGGATFADAIKIIFSVITSNVENAVLGAGDLVGSGLKAVGKGATAAGGAVVDEASSAVKGIGNLMGIGGKKNESEQKQ